MNAPCPSPFNLAAHVLARAPLVPDKTALRIVGGPTSHEWSFAALSAAVQGTATGLCGLGLDPGDRVLLRLGNTADFPISFLGAIWAGLVPVPTSAQLTNREFTAIHDRVRPRLILTDTPGAVAHLPTPAYGTDALRGFHDLPACPPFLGPPDRPAYVIFTSGTTGQPRGVVHAHRAIWARQMMMSGWYGLTPDDRVLHAGAFNWTYTLGTGLLDPWSIGATALVPATGTPSTALPGLLAKHRATVFAAAPGIYRQMLRHPMPTMEHLRHGLSAGEKLPSTLRQHWREQTGCDIHEAFGMSECSTFLSGCPTRPAPHGSLGYAQPGRNIRLINGEIAIRHDDPGLMLGYLDDPTGTAARYADGWFLSGDMAREEKGAFHYLGRRDDMINAGGFRISPAEIENVLTGHPGVSEAAATQVQANPDKTLIAAFVTGTANEAELRAHAAEQLARFKQPHLYILLDTLPRGANNKLSRRKLRQDWEAAHGQT